ncbi:hypothetical protein [Streptomyces sp. NBC_00105]|uniref:golvesin C-terminal-like domain-containing protein n=1 Tax=unclassified Streptomyces TaxID=2593676 RepID=UPI002883CEE3|nr:hypothetical protein [Streptomyces sp. DSM 41633]
MIFRKRHRAVSAVVAAGALIAGLTQAAAPAPARAAEKPLPAPAPSEPSEVPAGDRAGLLGGDWKKSADIAWTTSSDAQGLHLLTAPENTGYAWSTVASLSEPGFETDSWIGNTCVTGSGKRAVVVYAPRTFTNTPKLMARGAFAAVVELDTGHVTKLPVQVSLSYYNPGCGTGEDAVLTQSGGEDKASTRLFRLDTVTGTLSGPIETSGQVTSSVPVSDGSVLGAAGAQIVKIDTRGRKTPVVTTDTVPYRLNPDADGGIVFLDRTPENTARVKRVEADRIRNPQAKKAPPALLAEGPVNDTGLTRNAGTVYLTGKARPVSGKKLPRTVRHLGGVPMDATVSTRGEAVLTGTSWADGQGALVHGADPSGGRPVHVRMTVVDSGGATGFTVDPAKRTGPRIQEGRERTPALASPKAKADGGAAASRAAGAGDTGASASASGAASAAATAGGRNEVVESERVCSVPRNDPGNQAMQPKPRQVEWAVNQAIRGKLNTHVSRPANWKNLGMPAYQPQTLFPYPSDLLGGATIPAQVMLGITAQESNMWQASRVAVPGVTANPLIGNYYGIDLYDGNPANDWDVNWAEADCGYGITQVTDHMRMAGREDGHGGAAWDYQKQRAVALDYTANVAAGLRILAEKWQQTNGAGLKVNNGNSAKLENWTFALWAYNSGFYPDKGDGSPWGLGWANNPANPEWDAARSPFMEDPLGNEDPADAARPQHWPYQEKVLGFAAHPPAFLESPGKMVPAFINASWNGTPGDATVAGSALQNRARVKPPEDLFCTPLDNSCDPTKIGDGASNNTGAGPCIRDVDYKCWWHKSVQWKADCDYSCGIDFTRFPVTWPEEADGTAYPPNCTTSGLPAGALIVDDVPQGTPVIRSGCSNSSWTNQGTFTLDFGPGENACSLCYQRWPAKVDLHQLGAGFGSHFYFGHTRQADAKGERLKTTGSWKLGRTLPEKQAKVFVHLPDHGAQTAVAEYEIVTSTGVKKKKVNQKGTSNRWVELGLYRFKDVEPEVRLTTITSDGTGDQDIAFDAVAFLPGQFAGVDITLPEPDTNAANVDWNSINGGIKMQPPVGVAVAPTLPQGTGALQAAPTALPEKRSAAPKTGDLKCSAPNARGIKACSRILSGEEAAKKAAASPPKFSVLAAQAGDLLNTCPLVNELNSYTRFESCFRFVYEYFAVAGDGSSVGEARFDMYHQVKLEQKSGQFKQQLKVMAISIDPQLVNITLDIGLNCHDACTSAPEQWSASLTWVPGDAHTSTATRTHTWNNTSTTKTWDPLALDWRYQGFTPVAGPSAVKVTADDLLIQCDNYAITNTSGCTFGTYSPTYQFNSAKYPAAAAHAWLVQEMLPGHPGSKKHGKPMNFLPNTDKGALNKYKRDTEDNRKVICPTSYTYHPDTTLLHELVSTGTPDVMSCDEYAFAGTYQSAGMPAAMQGRNPVGSGDECLQTVAHRVVQGTWKLSDDDRADFPGFTEKCGRSSMSQWTNGGSMNRFYGFAQHFRLQDTDEYWVSVPGFEHCNVTAPLARCTMSIP